MQFKILLLLFSTLLFSTTSQAELFIELGLEGGGDDLSPTTNTGDTISAAGGIKFALGLENALSDSSALRLSAGYLFDSIDADDGDADYSTLTLDLTYLMVSDAHRFGIGATLHLSPEYSHDIPALFPLDDVTIEFDDALGIAFQYGYELDFGMEIGVRYTDITYDFNGIDVDASSFGMYIKGGF